MIKVFEGFRYNYEPGYTMSVTSEDNGDIILSANKEGLISIANLLIQLAEDRFSVGHHFHLNEDNGLGRGSIELTVIKD